MGAGSAKNPAPGREQMLEERTAIQSREPVEIAAPAVQDDPIEWHKKVHDKDAALEQNSSESHPWTLCGFLRAARLISRGSHHAGGRHGP